MLLRNEKQGKRKRRISFCLSSLFFFVWGWFILANWIFIVINYMHFVCKFILFIVDRIMDKSWSFGFLHVKDSREKKIIKMTLWWIQFRWWEWKNRLSWHEKEPDAFADFFTVLRKNNPWELILTWYLQIKHNRKLIRHEHWKCMCCTRFWTQLQIRMLSLRRTRLW